MFLQAVLCKHNLANEQYFGNSFKPEQQHHEFGFLVSLVRPKTCYNDIFCDDIIICVDHNRIY